MLRLRNHLRKQQPRTRAAALGAIVAVAVAVGILVAVLSSPSTVGAAQSNSSSGATTVRRRDLVATDTESGTLGYAKSWTIYNRIGGTITWLPAVGQVIKPGQTLYDVDNGPIVLFDGATPAYRDLGPSDGNGPDILELNRNLVALGFAEGQITVNNTWQAGTTAAVERWQASVGETQTGTITLGQVVFLPGPQLISSVSAVLGSTGGSGGSGNSGTGGTAASTQVATARPKFVSYKKPTTSSGASGATGPTGPTGPSGAGNSGGSSNAQLRALIALLQSEISELRASRGSGNPGGGSHSPSSSPSGSQGGGGGGSSGGGTGSGGGAQPIMQSTSTREVVTVQLDATKQSEAVVGERVTVQLPDGSIVDGKISQVSPIAQSSSSGNGNGNGGGSGGNGGNGGNGNSGSPAATIPVTITLTGHTRLSGLDQAAVSVNFAQQRATGVLSVPVTALIATQGGGYAVQTAASPHRLIPVTPGLFAAGYVQISGDGIYPGLQVTDSQG